MSTVWIAAITSFIASIRTCGYCIYTWSEKNKFGAVGLGIIAALCIGVFCFTGYLILTNQV